MYIGPAVSTGQKVSCFALAVALYAFGLSIAVMAYSYRETVNYLAMHVRESVQVQVQRQCQEYA